MPSDFAGGDSAVVDADFVNEACECVGALVVGDSPAAISADLGGLRRDASDESAGLGGAGESGLT